MTDYLESELEPTYAVLAALARDIEEDATQNLTGDAYANKRQLAQCIYNLSREIELAVESRIVDRLQSIETNQNLANKDKRSLIFITIIDTLIEFEPYFPDFDKLTPKDYFLDLKIVFNEGMYPIDLARLIDCARHFEKPTKLLRYFNFGLKAYLRSIDHFNSMDHEFLEISLFLDEYLKK